MKYKAIIFDIDGTIASNEHRQRWVRQKPKNWQAYNSQMARDNPIEPAIAVLCSLKLIYKILICSGREDVYRTVTEKWLKEHGIPYDELHMRKEKDYRDDCIIKKEILKILLPKYDITAVFDDRTKVVDMWRENGLYVFDCNQTREVF